MAKIEKMHALGSHQGRKALPFTDSMKKRDLLLDFRHFMNSHKRSRDGKPPLCKWFRKYHTSLRWDFLLIQGLKPWIIRFDISLIQGDIRFRVWYHRGGNWYPTDINWYQLISTDIIGNPTDKRVWYFLNHWYQRVGRCVLLNHHEWRECNDRNEWWFSRTHRPTSWLKWFRKYHTSLRWDFLLIQGLKPWIIRFDISLIQGDIRLRVWYHRGGNWYPTDINWYQLISTDITLKSTDITLKSTDITLIQPILTCDDSGLAIVLILEHSGTFWNILEHFGTIWNILEHSGTFWNILEHSGIFWNILEHNAYILEHNAYILEHNAYIWNILECSGTFWNILHAREGCKQLEWPIDHRQTDIH